MEKPFLTIITPTYNRAYILHQCYYSLCNQTVKNFEWIVIDDGSIDETEALVAAWIMENKINIRYIKQTNGGKHRAHNVGVSNAQGELVVCVDSDDALIENATKRIEEVWKQVGTMNVAGILALRGDFNKKPICSSIPPNLDICTTYDLAHKYHFSGDTILIYRKDILQAHLFPEFDGEKFISECCVYYEIDKESPIYLLNEVLYLCKYLNDGLSYKFLSLLKNNPAGTAYCYYVYLKNSHEVKFKIKYAIITNAYYSLIKNKRGLEFENNKLLLLITYPLGLIYRVIKINKIKE